MNVWMNVCVNACEVDSVCVRVSFKPTTNIDDRIQLPVDGIDEKKKDKCLTLEEYLSNLQ